MSREKVIKETTEVDAMLIKGAEHYAEKLAVYEERVKPILNRYFDPTNKEVQKISKVVADNIEYVKKNSTPQTLKNLLTRDFNQQIDALNIFRTHTDGLKKFLFVGDGYLLTAEIKKELDSQGITEEQFMSSLNVLFKVGENDASKLLRANIPTGTKQTGKGYFVINVNRALPQRINPSRRAKIIADLLKKIGNVDSKWRNVRNMMDRQY